MTGKPAHDPDSLLIRLRRWLVYKLDVKPAPGKSWCVNCALNGGRTRIMNADAGPVHAREHTAAGEQVTIQSAWPVNRD